MFRRCFVVLIALCFAFLDAWPSAAAVRYTVTDLGTLPGDTSSEATCINVSGQIVGVSRKDGCCGNAFLYGEGTMQYLGTLPGYPFARAISINAGGQIVENSVDSLGGRGRAFIYDNGTMTDLGTLGGSWSQALGMNDGGQVVGYSATSTTDNYFHAFVYSNGTMTDLAPPPGYIQSFARAINASGQVVMGANASATETHAFLWSNGAMTDLGTLGGSSSVPNDINDKGQVVGSSHLAGGEQRAFIYTNGILTDLGAVGGAYSSASSINNRGEVVGQYYNTAQNDYRAFIYSGGMTVDLNSLIDPALRWKLRFADCINDSGQIVGGGLNPNGKHRAFLLTPVPEPSTLVLVGMVAAGLIAYAWRRR